MVYRVKEKGELPLLLFLYLISRVSRWMSKKSPLPYPCAYVQHTSYQILKGILLPASYPDTALLSIP